MPQKDIIDNINQLGTQYKNISWIAFRSHLERMQSTLQASNLNEERRSWVIEVLKHQIDEYHYYQNIPERRPYIIEGDRKELEIRRRHLSYHFFYNNEEDIWKEKQARGEVENWEDIPKKIVQDIDARIKILDDRLAQKFAVLPEQVIRRDSVISAGIEFESASDEAINKLFCLGFSASHCDDLMKCVQIGPGYRYIHVNAKIWALLYVLEQYNLINCSPVEAAGEIGSRYGRKMAGKPSKAQDSEQYAKAFRRLSDRVKESIASKKYGPNYKKNTP